jgi:hypothetical protein
METLEPRDLRERLGAVRRLWKTKVMLPGWLAVPLIWLGALYVVATPLLGRDWYSYGFALLVALGIGLWVRSRYQVTVIERSERGIVIWIRWEKKAKVSEANAPTSQIELPRRR